MVKGVVGYWGNIQWRAYLLVYSIYAISDWDDCKHIVCDLKGALHDDSKISWKAYTRIG